MEFRDLKPEEIECRIGTCNERGVTLLLYKDARVDANILDETVGAENWQCKFYECKGTLFCSVGILLARPLDTGGIVSNISEWVWKDDAGAPSDMEAQKGEASDAFKRACFKWGIGRELYTAPFIWVPADKVELSKNAKGKWFCRNRFVVERIGITEKRIVGIRIVDKDSGVIMKSWKEG